MAHGLFITFEGGEGAGKTTLIQALDKHLRSLGYTVVKTREPGGSSLGDQIRALLLNPRHSIDISAEAELLLFLASRAQHITECIAPALQAGYVVLCDRFNDSTIAYQGVARGLGVKRVQQLCHLVCGPVTPALTFFSISIPKRALNERVGYTKNTPAPENSIGSKAKNLPFIKRCAKGCSSSLNKNLNACIHSTPLKVERAYLRSPCNA